MFSCTEKAEFSNHAHVLGQIRGTPASPLPAPGPSVLCLVTHTGHFPASFLVAFSFYVNISQKNRTRKFVHIEPQSHLSIESECPQRLGDKKQGERDWKKRNMTIYIFTPRQMPLRLGRSVFMVTS